MYIKLYNLKYNKIIFPNSFRKFTNFIILKQKKINNLKVGPSRNHIFPSKRIKDRNIKKIRKQIKNIPSPKNQNYLINCVILKNCRIF